MGKVILSRAGRRGAAGGGAKDLAIARCSDVRSFDSAVAGVQPGTAPLRMTTLPSMTPDGCATVGRTRSSHDPNKDRAGDHSPARLHLRRLRRVPLRFCHPGWGQQREGHQHQRVVVRRDAVPSLDAAAEAAVHQHLFPRPPDEHPDWGHERPAAARPVTGPRLVHMPRVQADRAVVPVTPAAQRRTDHRLAVPAAETLRLRPPCRAALAPRRPARFVCNVTAGARPRPAPDRFPINTVVVQFVEVVRTTTSQGDSLLSSAGNGTASSGCAQRRSSSPPRRSTGPRRTAHADHFSPVGPHSMRSMGCSAENRGRHDDPIRGERSGDDSVDQPGYWVRRRGRASGISPSASSGKARLCAG